MKRYINTILFLLLTVFWACSGRVEKPTEYTEPVVKSQPRFMYPLEAQKKQLVGTVKVALLISKTGAVERTDIVESTGYDILDNSAKEFCNGVLFTPAKYNGKDIQAWAMWTIKYGFDDQIQEMMNYYNEIKALKRRIRFANDNVKQVLEKEILKTHNEFSIVMKDGLTYNKYVKKVINKDLLMSWKSKLGNWPLSFLLYHDFIVSFPDYKEIEKVKDILAKAVATDIKYIQENKSPDEKEETGKTNLLRRIKSFMNRNYPEIVLPETGLGSAVHTTYLSIL